MPEPTTPWRRLAALLRAERQRQGLSRSQLADLAGVSAKSVQTAELGNVPKGRRPYTLDAIERALGWAAGSVDAVLEGGQPTERDSNETGHRGIGLTEDLLDAVRDVVDPGSDTDVPARARTARRLMAQLALELDEAEDRLVRTGDDE